MTKQKILDEALKLFTDKGYEGTSMDDIAKAVGIKKASIYAHYKGKESIFKQIFNDTMEEYTAYISELTSLNENEDVQQKLETIFYKHIQYCRQSLKMYFWDRYYYYPPEFVREEILEKTRETQDVFIERINSLFEKAATGESIAGRSGEMTLAYYYLLIGLSMSARMYDTERLNADAKAAYCGLLKGILNK